VPPHASRVTRAFWPEQPLASLSCARRNSMPDAPRPSSGSWQSNPPTPASARIPHRLRREAPLSGRAGHWPRTTSDGHAGRGAICGNRQPGSHPGNHPPGSMSPKADSLRTGGLTAFADTPPSSSRSVVENPACPEGQAKPTSTIRAEGMPPTWNRSRAPSGKPVETRAIQHAAFGSPTATRRAACDLF